MKTVFADAFYFVGLLNRADQHQGTSENCFSELS